MYYCTGNEDTAECSCTLHRYRLNTHHNERKIKSVEHYYYYYYYYHLLEMSCHSVAVALTYLLTYLLTYSMMQSPS